MVTFLLDMTTALVNHFGARISVEEGRAILDGHDVTEDLAWFVVDARELGLVAGDVVEVLNVEHARFVASA